MPESAEPDVAVDVAGVAARGDANGLAVREAGRERLVGEVVERGRRADHVLGERDADRDAETARPGADAERDGRDQRLDRRGVGRMQPDVTVRALDDRALDPGVRLRVDLVARVRAGARHARAEGARADGDRGGGRDGANARVLGGFDRDAAGGRHELGCAAAGEIRLDLVRDLVERERDADRDGDAGVAAEARRNGRRARDAPRSTRCPMRSARSSSRKLPWCRRRRRTP